MNEPEPAPPPFREAARFWWRLGWISFGGPTGQIAILHEELVDRKRWIAKEPFLHALNFCLMLPGPEAQQLATFLGWRLHGTRGALCAGLFFILPAVFILWALSLVYVLYGAVPLVAAAFAGLVPAVLAIVTRAWVRLAGKTLTGPATIGLALGAALVSSIWRDGYPLVVLTAGLAGWALGARTGFPSTLPAPQATSFPGWRSILTKALACLAAWWTPPFFALATLGHASTVTREGFFFSKASLVSFGGAYALLPYVEQHAVGPLHWLDRRDMLHGLALAETTPGPLIMVLQFVGFVGAWHKPGNLSPLAAATLGSLLTTWVTFAPSFLFILVGGPFVERLTRVAALQAALRGISAAVVGVMATFALWFGGHALFPHQPDSWRPDFFVLIVAGGALVALDRWRMGLIPILALCAGLGVLARLLGLVAATN